MEPESTKEWGAASKRTKGSWMRRLTETNENTIHGFAILNVLSLCLSLEGDESSKDRKVARWKRRPPPPPPRDAVPGRKREAASGMEWNGMPAACELHSWHELSTTRHPIDPPLTELLLLLPLPFRPEHVRTFFTVASVLVETWTARDATISPRSTTFSTRSSTSFSNGDPFDFRYLICSNLNFYPSTQPVGNVLRVLTNWTNTANRLKNLKYLPL